MIIIISRTHHSNHQHVTLSTPMSYLYVRPSHSTVKPAIESAELFSNGSTLLVSSPRVGLHRSLVASHQVSPRQYHRVSHQASPRVSRALLQRVNRRCNLRVSPRVSLHRSLVASHQVSPRQFHRINRR